MNFFMKNTFYGFFGRYTAPLKLKFSGKGFFFMSKLWSKFDPNRIKFNFFLRSAEPERGKGEKRVSTVNRRELDVHEVFLTQQDPRKKMSLIREVCLSIYFLLDLVPLFGKLFK